MFYKNQQGYSLFELVIVIVIIGFLTTVSLKSLKNTTEISRVEETKKELEQLANAIVGNPDLISNGKRIDFGYVGDVGSFPSNLDALVQNPGGYSTWKGPYLHDDFYISTGSTESEFKIDAWGTTYAYNGSTQITSNGSGSAITKQVANSSASILSNTVTAVITDLNNSPPGTAYKDSLTFILTYPNGTGSTVSQSLVPSTNGLVRFVSIPIGNHTLKIAYSPTGDTLTRIINIIPDQNYYTELQLAEEAW